MENFIFCIVVVLLAEALGKTFQLSYTRVNARTFTLAQSESRKCQKSLTHTCIKVRVNADAKLKHLIRNDPFQEELKN